MNKKKIYYIKTKSQKLLNELRNDHPCIPKKINIRPMVGIITTIDKEKYIIPMSSKNKLNATKTKELKISKRLSMSITKDDLVIQLNVNNMLPICNLDVELFEIDKYAQFQNVNKSIWNKEKYIALVKKQIRIINISTVSKEIDNHARKIHTIYKDRNAKNVINFNQLKVDIIKRK